MRLYVEPRAGVALRADGYARREPEHTVLHRVLREHWPVFVERAEQAGSLPRFVTREMQEYLRCGLLEHGCALLVCERCGQSMLVAVTRCAHCQAPMRLLEFCTTAAAIARALARAGLGPQPPPRAARPSRSHPLQGLLRFG